MMAELDIDDAFADPVVAGVLDRWWEARRFFPETAPYSGGVLDAWPAVDVDGFAVCATEELAIDGFLRWRKEAERV